MVLVYRAELRGWQEGGGAARAARGEQDGGRPMSETKKSENKRDYEVGCGKPPVHSRFKKGQSGNPRGPRPKNLPALLVEALNEKVVVTIDGERREITKREAVATQLVNKSTGADLRATKMLIDTLKDAEKKAGVTQPPEPTPFTAADEEVMATFIARLRQSWEEELQGASTENAGSLRER